MFDYQLSISEHRVRVQDVVQPRSHIMGQHTVRLSPVSTAELNPQGMRYCFAAGHKSISIPVLVNNTVPHSIKFSIESLDDASDIRYISVDRHGLGNLALVQRYPSGMPEEEFGPEPPQRKVIESNPEGQTPLQLEDTKGLVYIKVDRPGIVRLDSILDSEDEEIHIAGGTITIPECPNVSLEVDSREPHAIPKCQGDTFEGTLVVKGMPPLSVHYWREFDGKREDLYANGIDDDLNTSRGAQVIQVPVPLELPKAGSYSYGLTSVTDGLGNTVTEGHLPSASLSSFTVNVLSQPNVQWTTCSVERPRSMAKGASMSLPLRVSNGNASDAPWDVQIQHISPDGKASKQLRPVSFHTLRTQSIEVTEPGDYTLTGVGGKLCDGIVKEPEVCRVLVWPEPSMQVEFEPMVDKNCEVETGFMAHIVFQGTPPFYISYSVKKDGRVVDTRNIPNIQNTQYDLQLEPNQGPGSYQYSLTEFGDNHYKKQKPAQQTSTATQVVHTHADADLVRPSAQPLKLWSCSGDSLDIDLKLQGVAPWNIELQISSPHETKPLRLTGITSKDYQVSIPLPSDVHEYGGHFDIALVSVEDKKGCRRALNRPRIGVDVSRNKATARFTGAAAGMRDVHIIQGKSTKLPVRVTGDGPIRVRWENLDDGVPHWTTVRGQSEDLTVSHAGRYRLLEVVDAHGCAGYCDEQISAPITFIDRPSVHWPTTAGEQVQNGKIVRKAICEGGSDHVDLELSGTPLFTVNYKHELEGHASEAPPLEIASPLKSARIELVSSPPGKHLYSIYGMKDTNYDIRTPNLPSLEQEVLAKPSASFKSDARLPFCLHDSLIRRKGFPNAELALKGKAPFEVTLSIKNSDSTSRRTETILVTSNQWDVEFPAYTFDKIGPHAVRIESVKDANGCPEMPSESEQRSLFMDVAETAAILPMETRTDYCVGDTLQYQLEGTSPWIVTYDFNGRESRPTSKSAKFSRVAEKAGTFTVKSISHQNNLCITQVDSVKAVIHDLPSAIISPGRASVESIREGDQAEIVFAFTGEPPFTFTYQRSEISKKGKAGKVLETHTITGHKDKEYRFSSALEGTWTVTFVADKYCRYPPVPPSTEVTVETI
ncbi:hypothetical protein CALCODRAFT_500232 [Calocera cornea HHB12733]|uniref:Nucleoporin Pom152 n=1 Tax=Calocera cornea HHB12733 TaxID=1353952 RepID=A0A165E518_9BASI|nr:hypothetical protein CALCODRAFT_500232 [Calocera cornea HHB12733]